MFIPKLFKSEDRELMAKIISENAFAILISSKEKIRATHCMMLLNGTPDDFYIETHISGANPQAKILTDGDEVLLDFLGAHTYISSSWYSHENVSTWNYEAVQIYGKIYLMNDEELVQHLEKLTSKYESQQKCPFLVENMQREFVQKEMKGAFGIKVYPTEIYIKQKLSQNRNEKDYQNIIAELETTENENSKKIAAAMRKLRS